MNIVPLKLSVVAYACNLSIPELEKKSVQGHLLLQMKFKESLGYMRFSKGEKWEA